MILPGITIGDGAIIGTRALITKNVEPYTVVAGNPARVIRKRFSDDKIAMLLEMKWWSWPLDELKQVMKILTSGNIEALYTEWKSKQK